MFKKIKKISLTVTGLALVGVLSVGLNSSFTYQAGHADTPAPQRPDLTYSHGHTGGSPAYDHGRPPAPTNTHGETII